VGKNNTISQHRFYLGKANASRLLRRRELPFQWLGSIYDHVSDDFSKRGMSVRDSHDFTVTKSHGRHESLEQLARVYHRRSLYLGAFSTRVSEHNLSLTEPSVTSPSSWSLCDTHSKSRIHNQTPRRHNYTFSPILLYTACSQQCNLTGTAQELAHVSSHDETHITGLDATPSRFPDGSQPYAKHALNAGGTEVPHR
jgi:hypothetical protein